MEYFFKIHFRSFAEQAAQLSLRYAKNVFMHVTDVLGKDEGHVLVEEYKQRSVNERERERERDGDKSDGV